MKRTLLIALATLVPCVSALAQTAAPNGSLHGVVRDESGSPLAGATVAVAGLGGEARSATSDASGRFTIDALEPGPYRVSASLPGFSRHSEHVLVEPGPPTRATINLRLLLLEQLVEAASRKARTVREAPATVYVITEAMIRERGYTFLYDALRDAPGMDITWMGGLYGPILMPRGVDTPENNKLVLMIDGQPDNNLSAGTAQVYMQYSLHDVKRIEIIYGPASALYGANAMVGLVNVVTRAGGDLKGIRVQAGGIGWDPELRRTGALLALSAGKRWAEDGFEASFGAHWVDTDGTDLRIDADEPRSDLPGDPGGSSYFFSPDYLGANEDGTFMVQGRLRHHGAGLTFGGHLWRHDGGLGGYGHEGFVFLNALQDRPGTWNYRNATVFGSWQRELGADVTNRLTVTYRDTTLTDGYDLYFNRTGTGPDGPGDAATTGSARYYRPDRSWKIDDHVAWDLGEDMSLTAGVSAEFQYVSDYQTGPGISFDRQQLTSDAPEPVVDDTRRYDYDDYSLYAEHHWDVSERLSLLTGARLDLFQVKGERTPAFFGTRDLDAAGNCIPNAPFCVTQAEADAAGAEVVSRVFYIYGPYDDTRTTFNPRVGAVWSAVPDRLTVKAMYGEGFRVPTVRELFSVSGSRFSNPDLAPEKIRTAEVSGTWQIPERGFVEAGVFYTRAKGLIQLVPSPVKRPTRSSFLNQFQNIGELHVVGFETRAQVQLTSTVDAFAHYAYNDPQFDEIDDPSRAHDPDTALATDTTDRVPRQSAHKGLVGATISAWKRRLIVSPRLKLVGARPGVVTSPIQQVDAYASLDLSVLVRDVLTDGLDLQLSAFNLANEDILDPGFRTAVKTGDFPAAHAQPGRHVYVKLVWNRPF